MIGEKPQLEKKRGPYEKIRDLQTEYKILIVIEENTPPAPEFNKFLKTLEQVLRETRIIIGSEDLQGLRINITTNPEAPFDNLISEKVITNGTVTIPWKIDSIILEGLIMKNYGQQFLETAEFDTVETDEYKAPKEGKDSDENN
ncbi:MAG: hypothetical protein ABID45_01885 [Patescibacteria group bacterium]